MEIFEFKPIESKGILKGNHQPSIGDDAYLISGEPSKHGHSGTTEGLVGFTLVFESCGAGGYLETSLQVSRRRTGPMRLKHRVVGADKGLHSPLATSVSRAIIDYSAGFWSTIFEGITVPLDECLTAMVAPEASRPWLAWRPPARAQPLLAAWSRAR